MFEAKLVAFFIVGFCVVVGAADSRLCEDSVMGTGKSESVVFGKVKFNKFGSFQNQEPIMVIPGGPWISGEYLDEFSEKLSSGLKKDVYRASLPNHENDYNNSNGLRFNQIVKLFEEAATELAKSYGVEPIIVGHSYGSIIATHIAIKDLVMVRKVVLVSPTTSLEHWDLLQEKLAANNLPQSENFTQETQFSAWWEKVARLYFASDPEDNILSLLTNRTFMRGNEVQNGGIGDLLAAYGELASRASLQQKEVLVLQGERDPIGPRDNLARLENLFGMNIKVIPGVGHFPMLENGIATINHIQYFILLSGV